MAAIAPFITAITIMADINAHDTMTGGRMRGIVRYSGRSTPRRDVTAWNRTGGWSEEESMRRASTTARHTKDSVPTAPRTGTIGHDRVRSGDTDKRFISC